jgi:hypothetical protein
VFAALSCLTLLVVLTCLADGFRWLGPTFVFLVILWAGLESGLLPWAIAFFASRAARNLRPGESIRSRWVIEADLERRQRLQRFHDDTEDNPTIR